MSTRYFSIREKCRGCGGGRLEAVVKLNPLPLVSPNVGVAPGEAADTAGIFVPADLYLCGDCGLLQITAVINPGFQYNKFKYVTTISAGLPEHFRKSAGEIIEQGGLTSSGRVLEVGSNDGTLLRAFRERSWDVLGIDPAEKAAAVAKESGVPTVVGFFNASSAHDIRKRLGSAHLVIANNTLANIDDLDGVAKALDIVLDAGGIFVFETSYGADVVRRTLLDTIYHEHLSYFMVKPLQAYFALHGFELFHVDTIATKGGSIRGFVQRAGGSRKVTSKVAELIAAEERDGLCEKAAYGRMEASIASIRNGLRDALDGIGGDGAIAAYGASVGCVTLINQLGLGNDIACVFDDQPLLETISGPGYDIPVAASDDIYNKRPKVIVVLAWRYADLIMQRHAKFRAAGGRFLMPLPHVSLQ